MAIGKHYDLDTDITLANNSDNTIASQKAIKTYVDVNKVSSVIAGNTSDQINIIKNNSTSTITIDNVGNATKATQDASGNVITTTYATKTEVNDIYAVTFVDWSS